jgi:hypothetical protein
MEMESPVRFWTHTLEGLVAVRPKVSGVPFWVLAWAGGMLRDAVPMVLVTPGPDLRDCRVARVALYPEVAVLDGPAIEVDEEFGRLAAWLEANRDAIADYWYQLDPAGPGDLLSRIRPVRRAALLRVGPAYADA